MYNNKTILTFESQGKKHSSELNWDADLYTIMDSLAGLLVCATFPYETIINTMHEWSQNQKDAYFPKNEEDE